MTVLDYSLFGIYMVGVLFLGIWMRSKNDGDRDRHYTAGRSMPWIPIGLSVMVTAFSSINFMAFPSEVFSNGLYVIIALPVFILVAVPVTRYIIPFFHGLGFVSIYEFLEHRFSLRVRLLASSFFIIWRVIWMAVALYAAGRMLKAIFGFDIGYVILFAGLFATCYTAIGGMRSVIWTDFAQFMVLFGGIVVSVIVAVQLNPNGWSGIFADGLAGGLLRPYAPFDPSFFSLNPTIRITVWSGLIGTFVAFLTRYGADQVVVQRYMASRSLKNLRQAFWLNAGAAIFAISALGLFGLAIYSFAVQKEIIHKGLPALKYMGLMIEAMPSGISGLIVSGLMAATMSSIDSGINSCSAVWHYDFRERLFKNRDTIFSEKMVTLAMGIGVTVGALLLMQLLGPNQSLFKIINKIINGIGSPLLALMLGGMFFQRLTSHGVFWGGICGFVFSIVVTLFVNGLSLHYYGVVNFVGTFVFIITFSAFGEGSTERQRYWLYRAVISRKQQLDE